MAEEEKRLKKSKQSSHEVIERKEKRRKKRKHGVVENDDIPADSSPSKKSKLNDGVLSKKPVQLSNIRSSPLEFTHETIESATHAQSETPLPSPFLFQTASFYLPLSPISLLHPLSGLCAEHLSPLIFKYHQPLQGFVLSYGNIRLAEEPEPAGPNITDTVADRTLVHLTRCVDEYAASYIWVTVDLLIFRPQIDDLVKGWINLRNDGHVGLVCWNFFSASIPRARLPTAWRWSGTLEYRSRSKMRLKADGEISAHGGQNTGSEQTGFDQEMMASSQISDDPGFYEDEHGYKVEGLLVFRIFDLEVSPSSDRERNHLSIEGSLAEKEVQRESRDVEVELIAEGSRNRKKKRRKNLTADSL